MSHFVCGLEDTKSTVYDEANISKRTSSRRSSTVNTRPTSHQISSCWEVMLVHNKRLTSTVGIKIPIYWDQQAREEAGRPAAAGMVLGGRM
jgi:hypothetical protein